MAKSYFSHDSNAKDDPKIIKLIDSLGLEGYGAFWVLIESLREQPNLRLPIISIPRLSRTFGITQQKLEGVIYHFDLFQNDGEYFFSASLINRMNEMVEKLSKRSLKGWETKRQLIDNQEESYQQRIKKNQKNANEMKGKEIKGNEIKVVDERYSKLYEMFYRVSKWDANKISEQVGKFINKYPEVPLNQSGPLVNSWVSNYREFSTTKKLVQ